MNGRPFRSGLIIDDATLAAPRMKVPAKWSVPKRVDFRDYVLPPSNQGEKPYCAAYTMAAYLEVMNWRKHDGYAQIDADGIYVEAKKIDGNNDDGTTFPSVIQAAKNLKLLKPEYKMRTLRTLEDVQYAMHCYGICLCGVMVTEAWYDANPETGRIPELPDVNLGGHAILLNYMDLRENIWGLENSWVPWGKNSYGELTDSLLRRKFLMGAVIERDDV